MDLPKVNEVVGLQWNEISLVARERLRGYCRVCPWCNGKACAGEVPGMGGIGTGSSFMDNYKALEAWKLNMRTVHGAKEPDIGLELFGSNFSMPILGAPIAGAEANLGGALTDDELTESLLEGCYRSKTVGMVPAPSGDFALNFIKEHQGKGILIHKPKEQEEIIRWGTRAAKAGALAFGCDIDGAGLLNMRLQGQYVEPKTFRQVKELVSQISLPFILKGIMTPDEAELAVEAGVAAIVVSNHGGRVLDHTPGTAQVLPAVAKRVKGRIPILVDGAIQTGVDVLKMLALGADAVLIGRRLVVAAVGGGTAGVEYFLRRLANELVQAMILTGCNSLKDIGSQILVPGN
jgi:4-hydroxymandelate oxidase